MKDVEKIDSPATIRFKAKQKAEAAKRLEVDRKREEKRKNKLFHETRQKELTLEAARKKQLEDLATPPKVKPDSNEPCRPPDD